MGVTCTSGYLTVEEVAELARCEVKTVRRAIASGNLVAFQPAKRYLVREPDARSWVESRPARVRDKPRVTSGRGRERQGPGSVASLRELERRAEAGN